MKILKRIGIGISILAGSLVLLSVILGYAYQDKLQMIAIEELERTTGSQIIIEKADVSFLRNWPYVTVSLKKLGVRIPGEAGPGLGNVDEALFKLDLLSLFSDQYRLKKVVLIRPTISLATDSMGVWNYRQLVKGDSSAHSNRSSNLLVSLQKMEIEDGRLLISNSTNQVHIELDSISLSLSGDFTDALSLLQSEVDFRIKNWESAGFTWLSSKSVHGEFAISAQSGDTSKYHFKTGKLSVEDLDLDVTGDLAFAERDIGVDFSFLTNQNSFSGFLSLLPAGLVNFGKEYEYGGNFALDGTWSGWFKTGENPVLGANFDVSDGMMQYAGYSTAARQIKMIGEVFVDPSHPKNSYLDVREAAFQLGEGTLNGHLSYKNFENPRFAGKVKGKLDMVALNEFYPLLADSMELKGEIIANIAGNGRLSDLKNHPERLHWDGDVNMTGVAIEGGKLELPISSLSGKLSLNKGDLRVRSVSGYFGDSDFQVNGKLIGFLPYLFDSTKGMSGALAMNSRKVDLNQMMLTDESRESKGEDRYEFEFPDNIDVVVTAKVDEFLFDEMNAKITGGSSRIHSDGIIMTDVDLLAYGGTARINGKVDFIEVDRASISMSASWKNLDVNPTFKTFRQWADLSLVEDHIHGKFDGQLSWSGEINDQLLLNDRSLRAEGHVDLFEGQIIDYEPLQALAGFVRLDKLKDIRFKDIHTDFTIRDGYFNIPDLHLEAHDYVIDVKGRHGLDNTLDYELLVDLPPMLAKKSKSNRVQDYIEVNSKTAMNVILPIKVSGTVDDPEFTYDFKYATKAVKKEVKEEKKELVAGLSTDAEAIFGQQDDEGVDDWIVEAEKPVRKQTTGRNKLDIGGGLRKFGGKLLKR